MEESITVPHNLSQPTVLGRTGLKVGRLGISSSFGAPAAAFEEAYQVEPEVVMVLFQNFDDDYWGQGGILRCSNGYGGQCTSVCGCVL